MYETLNGLVDVAFPQLNSPKLYDRILEGLADDQEIKLTSNLMIAKLLSLAPSEISSRLDSIAERYTATLRTVLKENAVKQEREKAREANNDALKTTLRINRALKSVPRTAQWIQYTEMINKDFKTPLQLADAELQNEQR